MPRYFFHTAGGSFARDVEGVEFANETIARQQAISFAGALLRDDPSYLSDNSEFHLEVTDESNMTLFTIVTMALDSCNVSRLQSF